MNEFLVRLRLVALTLTVIATGCSSEGGERAEPPLAGASIGGDFALIDENGDPVSESDFDGRYRLVYFGYTFCPDVCPVDMQKLGQGMRALEQSDPDLAARIQPLFVSVDPARDTPEILREFTDNFHPRLIGMTGDKQQIDAMTQAYGSYYALGEPDAQGNYLVNHSNNVLLFGPDGEPLAIIAMQGSGEEIAAEIERWAA